MNVRSVLGRGLLAGVTVLGMAGGSLALAASTAGASTTGTIAGRVALSGKPASTASGVCLAFFTAGGFETTTAGTGATGAFSVQGFTPTTSYVVGAFTAPTTMLGKSLTCTKSPYFSARYSGDTSTFTSAARVKGQSTGVDVTLPAAGVISGTVTSTTGVALQGVCVQAHTAGFHSFLSTTTSSKGAYSFEGLTPVSYTVNFTATCPTAPSPPGYMTATTRLTVTAGATKSYTARLTLAGGIEGQVTNSSKTAVSTVCVGAFQVTGTSYIGGTPTYTASTGSYTLNGLNPAKQYVVRFSTSTTGCGLKKAQNYITQYYDDKATIRTAAHVSLSPGTYTPGISPTLAVGGEITGTVKSTTGTALGTICVTAQVTGGAGTAGSTTTSTTGTYTVMGLHSGTYKVEFSPCPGATGHYVTQYWNAKSTRTSATKVTVTAGGTPASGINATLTAGGTLKGTVDSSVGTGPATSVCVDVYQGTKEVGSTVTGNFGTSGAWSLNVPAGTYTIKYHSGCGGPGYIRQTSSTQTVSQNTTTVVPTVTLVPGTAPVFTTQSPPTTAKVGTPYSYTFHATGTPAVTYSFSFAPGVPSWLHITASSGKVSGTPTATGTFSLQVLATNGVTGAPNVSYPTTITVSPGTAKPTTPALATGSSNTISTVYGSATITYASTGTPTPTLSVTGTLPAYTTSTATTAGTIKFTYAPPGTTKVAAGGTYPITITAHNSHGTTSLTTDIVVETAPRLKTTSAACTLTAPCSHQYNATGYPPPTYTVTNPAQMPPGLALSSSGLLSGTPTKTGTYFVTVKLSNPVQSLPTELVVTVSSLPVFTSVATATFAVGTAGSFKFTATGYPAPRFFITPPTTTPTGTMLSGTHLTTLTAFTGGKDLVAGTYHFKVTASNTAGTTPQTFTLIVVTAPGAPTVSAGSLTFKVGTAGSVTFHAAGTPAPTYSTTSTLPTGLSLTPTSGVLSGTPAAATSGIYPVTVVATNGGGTASATFTLTVSGPPHTVTPAGAKLPFKSGFTSSVTFRSEGYPVPTLSLYTTTLPAGLTYTVGANGTLVVSGDPNAATVGAHAIHVKATNATGIVSASDTLVVEAAPAFTGAKTATFTVSKSGTFQVTASGYPAPTFSTTGTLPKTLTLASTGKLSGTPAATTGGVYHVTVTAANTAGSTKEAVTLTVDQAPAFTSANKDTFTVGKPGTFQVVATGYPAPTFSTTSTLPKTVTLTATTGKLSGTPAAGTAATYTIAIKATNAAGIITQTFTLVVNQAPVITSTAST
ncbi:MAG: beta strand repeat-containing protein, partial [Acidimicrobiales bacterium]